MPAASVSAGVYRLTVVLTHQPQAGAPSLYLSPPVFSCIVSDLS
jgi:hypothetical protein